MPVPSLRVKAGIGGMVILLGVGAGVSASAAPAGPAVRLDRTSVVLADEDTTTIGVHLDRGTATGPATVTIKNLPAQARAELTPAATTSGSDLTLRLTTGPNTPLGRRSVRVVAAIRHDDTAGAATQVATATLSLTVVREIYADFAVTGTADRPLAPGVTALLDLRITNPNPATLKVSAVRVALVGTSRASCGPANYTVTGYAGPVLRVPPRASRTLRQLGVTAAALPTVTMLDLATNQDRCHGVTVTLSFSGTGKGRSA